MLKIKLLLVTTLLILSVGCTSNSAKISFDKNTNIDTKNYKTFAWLTTAKIMAPPTDINPVMKVRVDESIEQAFIAKGYQLIDDAEKADFTISYTVGSREEIKVNSYPSTYNTGFGWGSGYYGGRGFYGASMGTDTSVRQYTQGKLAIDVYDVKTHQPVWHGWATKRLSSDDKETPSATINDVVSQVVNQFN
ncbi:DUF4136 domain-containing protein [Colwellia sp. D2M02]|uniref:DUF4136 domain-containing protein n=1 Tax=Colwellia asteriadis TaxID=517723 RepID=A0ABN1L9V3_9GAMM|nr:DUF4136 domain-containing protein [Colwellia sp. D2M02]MBU2895091.1 DUF4136 domain-containing protein [Colwellia sp. D2M02]